jgi:hypothetical protein
MEGRMKRAALLQDRRMQKFGDVLSRWKAGSLSMAEAGGLPGISERQFPAARPQLLQAAEIAKAAAASTASKPAGSTHPEADTSCAPKTGHLDKLPTDRARLRGIQPQSPPIIP